MAEETAALEDQWGDAAATRRKKGVPSWVWWGCGGGCLLLTLIGIVAVIAGGTMLKRAADPERAWPEVQQLMPFDERPPGWDARGISMFGMGQFVLVPNDGKSTLLVMRFPDADSVAGMLDPETPENKGAFGVGEISNPEPGTIELQGREVRCLRFHAWVPQFARDGEDKNLVSMRIDLSGEGGVPAMLQIMLVGGGERVEDEYVRTLLAPFDLWRGR